MNDPIRYVYQAPSSTTMTTATVRLQRDAQEESLWVAVDTAARELADPSRAYVSDPPEAAESNAANVLCAEAAHSAAVRTLRVYAESNGQPVLVLQSWEDDLAAARLLVALDAADSADIQRGQTQHAVDEACDDLVTRAYRPTRMPSMIDLAGGSTLTQDRSSGTREPGVLSPADMLRAMRDSSGELSRVAEAAHDTVRNNPEHAPYQLFVPDDFVPGELAGPERSFRLQYSSGGVCIAARQALDAVIDGVLAQVRAVGEGVASVVLPKSLDEVRERVEAAFKDAGRFLRRALDRLAGAIEWVLARVGLERLTDAVESGRAAAENPSTLVPPLLNIPEERSRIEYLVDDPAVRGEAASVAEAYLVLLRHQVNDNYAELATTVKTVTALAGVASLIPVVGSRVRNVAGIFLAGSLAYALHAGRDYVQGTHEIRPSVRGTLLALQSGQIEGLRQSLRAAAIEELRRSLGSSSPSVSGAGREALEPRPAELAPAVAQSLANRERVVGGPDKVRHRRAILAMVGIVLLLSMIALFAMIDSARG